MVRETTVHSTRSNATRVLITGVAGFCGAHLAGRLRREGAVHLTGVDRAARPAQCPVDEYYVADLDNEQEVAGIVERSEEHTSELQSPCNLVCRLLLEKKKKQ